MQCVSMLLQEEREDARDGSDEEELDDAGQVCSARSTASMKKGWPLPT